MKLIMTTVLPERCTIRPLYGCTGLKVFIMGLPSVNFKEENAESCAMRNAYIAC